MTTFRVILLDDTVIERNLEKKALGQVLFDQVCEHLNLLERDYFGLAALNSSNSRVWLDLSKQVHKQIISQDGTFTFCVKFYPPDPTVLAEDITRYLLCLQLRTDILTSRLACPSDMLAVLGSYTIHSEFGDYNPELHGKEFFSKIPLAPNQTSELEENVAELHCTLRPMSPAQADQLFLQNVKTLDMYGVHLHPAKDASGGDVMVGVCADGLVVYEDEEKTQSFIWPNVVHMSYNHSKFHVGILQSEDVPEYTIKFILPNYRASKHLWRIAVEHHAFFRNVKDLDKAPKGLLRLGSKFRFNGLTHAESAEASSTIKRPAPRFPRSAIKRKAKESLLVDLKRPNRTEFDDWFQVLGSDESWPTFVPGVHTDKDKMTGGESLAYKEREKVDELDNEWFQLFGGRSFPTQHTLSSLSSDTEILESATFKLWKLCADDWFVLLEPHTYQPSFRPLKTRQLSLQSSQTEDQKEELEWIERTSDRSIKIVKIAKEVKTVTEQHEELEMERSLMRPDVVGENLELDIGANEQLLNVMREKIERDGAGEEIDTVVMYEQRTQEVKSYAGLSQEVFVEQKVSGMEVVHELMLKTGQVVSEENIEQLEDTLLEVERIEQRLQDIERVKVRLQEVEFLEQKLQQAERRQRESDDWYILLEYKLIESSAPKQLLGMKSFEQKLQDIEQKRQEQGEKGDWYLLLDPKPLVVSSANAADATEQKAEIRQRIEELQRANTITPVQMKDDWYILLELPPQYTKTTQPAQTPPETDIQSSWAHVEEEKKWQEEGAVHVRETQPTLSVQIEEQTQKQVEDGWFIQEDVSPKRTATIEEKEETFDSKLMIIKEEQVIVGGVEKEMREDEDNWSVVFSPAKIEKKVITTVPMTLISEDLTGLRPQQTVMSEEKEVTFDKKSMIIKEEQVIVGGVEKKIPSTMREDEDNWSVLFSPAQTEKKVITTVPMTLISEDLTGLRTQQTVTTKEKEVTFDKKPMIIREKQIIEGGVEKKIPSAVREGEDNWSVLFSPAEIEMKVITRAGVSDTWILEEKRLKEVQKVQLREDVKKSHVVENKGLHIYVPEPKAEERNRVHHRIDDWFILLDPVSETSVSMDMRAEEDQRRKEKVFKKQALVEDKRKLAGFKPPSVSVIPMTPSDQPMTSTPTAQYIRVARPTYQEESLKRIDITQEITQDIKQESKVETESIIKRKRRETRIEGESIYIRHSILMLEDSDLTQEVVLRHHASISELKRLFMEDMPVSCPTEWEKRLSTYIPVVFPKLSNGELFTGIDITGADVLSAA